MNDSQRIRITRFFEFEMAHVLQNHQGLCQYIHGHSYKLEVCIIGQVNSDPSHPELGMVVDFSRLKNTVKTAILDDFDHALVLNRNSPYQVLEQSLPKKRLVMLEVEPTSENILIEFVQRLRNQLPPFTDLHHLRLHETSTAFAEWYASDNPGN